MTLQKGTTGAAALMALFACGCSSSRADKPEWSAEYQDDVGSVSVAVQSVGSFETYVQLLQPKFSLTADAALSKVIPVTQVQQLQELRSIAAFLRLSVAEASASKQPEPAPTPQRSPTSSAESGLSAKASDSATAKPAEGPLDLPKTATPGLDPLLQYRAATALMQEVALLSSYVRDAAVRQGTIPYVVRLLVTALPSRPDCPYDAYVSMAFFTDPVEPKKWVPLLSKGSFLDSEEAYQVQAREMLTAVVPDSQTPKPIEVVPLFVTDDIASSMTAVSSVVSASASVDLGGGWGPVNIGAGGSRLTSSDARSVVQILSGVQTIGRRAPNVLEVRLGAANVEGKYRLIPRTYAVTVLLLVPTAAYWSTELDAWLSSRSPALLEKIRESLITSGGPPDRLNTPEKIRSDMRYHASVLIPFSKLRYSAAPSFRATATGFEPPKRPVQEVLSLLPPESELRKLDDREREIRLHTDLSQTNWYDVVEFARYRGKSGGTFTLPRQFLDFYDDSLRGAIAEDDGTQTALLVAGVTGLSQDGIFTGKLTVTWGASGGHSTWDLNITGVTVSPDGRSTALIFPSVAKVGPSCPKQATATAQTGRPANVVTGRSRHPAAGPTAPSGHRAVARTTQTEVPCPVEKLLAEISYQAPSLRQTSLRENVWNAKAEIHYVRGEDAKPKPSTVSLTASSPRIVSSADGHGEIGIELRSKNDPADPETVILSVEGATIASVTGEVMLRGADRIATTGQILVLSLRNLVPGSQVRIHARPIADPQASGGSTGTKKIGDNKVEAVGSPADLLVVETRQLPLARR